jgi:predicted nuclease of predicted toxin-antitoxin system
MSRPRLYVDEDASESAVVIGLRARGVDLVTTSEAGRLGATDEEQLAYAATEDRAIYTFNTSDFARLHREFLERGRAHAGIIVIPEQRYSTGEKIRRVAALVQSMTAESIKNRIEYL